MPLPYSRLRMVLASGVLAAVIGAMAQLTIPLPLVPITGQTLAVGLAATILGSRYGSVAVVLYLVMGALGLPVFSGLASGPGVLFGKTGGFLLGFIPTAFTIGYYLERTRFTVARAVVANTIGMFVALTFGAVWLKVAAELSWTAAFQGGFAPFVIGGVVKACLAAWVGILIRRR